jgi:DNA adenine methylase
MKTVARFPVPYGSPALFDNIKGAKPIVKWVGGKTESLDVLIKHLPPVDLTRNGKARYFEPFVGGAALFFALCPYRSVISDSNAELINLYGVVKHDTEALIAELKRPDEYLNTRDDFNRIRAWDRQDRWPFSFTEIERAARFLYLNKTAFNGLYRVSMKGYHNVPFGGYENPTICNEKVLKSASAALRRTDMIPCRDFREMEDMMKPGDTVYIDPPYFPLTTTADFTAYTAAGFTEDNQRELSYMARRLTERGVYVMVSNHDVPEVRHLYRGFHFRTIEVRRNINCKANGRDPVKEVLITGYTEAGIIDFREKRTTKLTEWAC